MSAMLRHQILEAIAEAVASGARLFRACEVLQLSERRVRRWRATPEDGRTGGYRATDQKLSEAETDRIVELVNRHDVKDLPLKAAYTTLLDEGIYLASYSTVDRVMKKHEDKSTTVRKKRKGGKRPELKATGPNQVWCWDITWLESALIGKYFFLYMIIDMYSRKVVGWSVHTKENGRFARDLFARTLTAEGIGEGQIIIHADRGKPMRSRTLRRLFNLLGVVASYSRPHTSNDNAYAESLFATFKNRVAFPQFFASIEAAESYCDQFVAWYNDHHYHSGLDDMTPSMVHAGRHGEIFSNRNALLEEHRLQHPTRHGGTKKVYGLPEAVELKHRVHLDTATAKDRRAQKSEANRRKKDILASSGEADAGSGGDQPARNTLTHRNDREGSVPSPLPSSSDHSDDHPSKNSKSRTESHSRNGHSA